MVFRYYIFRKNYEFDAFLVFTYNKSINYYSAVPYITLVLPPGESVRTPTVLSRFPNPPSFDAPARGIPSEFLDEIYIANRRGMGLLYGENCTILSSTLFDWSTRVTDRRTDRQTDGLAIACSALSMLSRANKSHFSWLKSLNGDRKWRKPHRLTHACISNDATSNEMK